MLGAGVVIGATPRRHARVYTPYPWRPALVSGGRGKSWILRRSGESGSEAFDRPSVSRSSLTSFEVTGPSSRCTGLRDSVYREEDSTALTPDQDPVSWPH